MPIPALAYGVHCIFCGIDRWLGVRTRGKMETRNHRLSPSHSSAFSPIPTHHGSAFDELLRNALDVEERFRERVVAVLFSHAALRPVARAHVISCAGVRVLAVNQVLPVSWREVFSFRWRQWGWTRFFMDEFDKVDAFTWRRGRDVVTLTRAGDS